MAAGVWWASVEAKVSASKIPGFAVRPQGNREDEAARWCGGFPPEEDLRNSRTIRPHTLPHACFRRPPPFGDSQGDGAGSVTKTMHIFSANIDPVALS